MSMKTKNIKTFLQSYELKILLEISQFRDIQELYISTGDTIVESIIAKQKPYIFGYEITKPSLPMRRAAYKARGVFEYSALDATHTVTKWTYSFQQKHLAGKFFLSRYINNTHKFWMKDMLHTTRIKVEEMYTSLQNAKQ